MEARRLIESTVSALAEDAELLNEQELKQIRLGVQELLTAVEGEDLERIEQLQKNLTQATEEFAARRMDKAIAMALSGKNVDEI